MNVGVLASGSGTNLQALLDAQAAGTLSPARIVVVGANVPECQALKRATKAGVETFVVDHRSFFRGGAVEAEDREDFRGDSRGDFRESHRESFDRSLTAALRAHQVDLVVLAGFMRILTPVFLAAFPARVINIHPSLLPAFPGVRAQAQAFNHGVKVTGCTVHFVEDGVDSGPIIAQAAVPVRDDDDADSLRLRILTEEHALLPSAVRAIAEGRVSIDGRRVKLTPVHSCPSSS
jgi:phosphoribosylglycinamide formyltransferase 1